VSWFTFKDLFWRCHVRPICAPTLSFAGHAIDQLSRAIASLDEVSSSLAVRPDPSMTPLPVSTSLETRWSLSALPRETQSM